MTHQQRDSAERSFDNYRQRQEQQPDAAPLAFDSYVASTQEQNAERMDRLKQKAESLDFTDGGLQPFEKGPPPVKAKTGAYVAIDERGDLHEFDRRATGLYPAEVQKFFEPMDAKPVQSVTAARQIMADRQQERREAVEARRLERAGNIDATARGAGKENRRVGVVVKRGIRQGLSFIGGGLNFAVKALESLLAPPTPKTAPQIKEENRLGELAAAQDDRATTRVDYDAEHDSTKARQQDEAQRAQSAADQYERLQRDRGEGRERER